jgi:hypothetical protein
VNYRWNQLLRDVDVANYEYTPPSTAFSVLPGDVSFYGSANMPEQDALTVGGAIDFTRRIDLSDITPAGTLDVVSSALADGSAVQCKYGVRDPTGAEQTVTVALNGQTPVLGSQSAERLLYGMLSGATANGPSTAPTGTAAAGDVALFAHTRVLATHTAQAASNSTVSTPALIRLQAGDGGAVAAGQIIRILNNTPAGVNFQLRRIIATSGYGGGLPDYVAVNRDWTVVPTSATTYEILQGMLFDNPPGFTPVTCVLRLFERVAADIPTGSQRIYYEKVFAVNNNTGISLTQAQIQIASEIPTLPTGVLLDAALTTVLNDTGTVANRQTAPATGIGAFITQPAFINIPAPGNLPAGTAPNAAGSQGMWLRYTLPAGSAAYKGALDIRTVGVTT